MANTLVYIFQCGQRSTLGSYPEISLNDVKFHEMEISKKMNFLEIEALQTRTCVLLNKSLQPDALTAQSHTMQSLPVRAFVIKSFSVRFLTYSDTMEPFYKCLKSCQKAWPLPVSLVK